MKFWKQKSFKRAARGHIKRGLRAGAAALSGGQSEILYAQYQGATAKVQQYLPPKLQTTPPVMPGNPQQAQAPFQKQRSQRQERPWWASGGR